MDRSVRGKVAVVGVGETKYYKRGQAPDAEFKLALMAVIEACKDAGISPTKVDGFASFSNDFVSVCSIEFGSVWYRSIRNYRFALYTFRQRDLLTS